MNYPTTKSIQQFIHPSFLPTYWMNDQMIEQSNESPNHPPDYPSNQSPIHPSIHLCVGSWGIHQTSLSTPRWSRVRWISISDGRWNWARCIGTWKSTTTRAPLRPSRLSGTSESTGGWAQQAWRNQGLWFEVFSVHVSNSSLSMSPDPLS